MGDRGGGYLVGGGWRPSGVLSRFALGALVCIGVVRHGCVAGSLDAGFGESGVVAGRKRLALLGLGDATRGAGLRVHAGGVHRGTARPATRGVADRKSTRLNSSHLVISYA